MMFCKHNELVVEMLWLFLVIRSNLENSQLPGVLSIPNVLDQEGTALLQGISKRMPDTWTVSGAVLKQQLLVANSDSPISLRKNNTSCFIYSIDITRTYDYILPLQISQLNEIPPQKFRL